MNSSGVRFALGGALLLSALCAAGGAFAAGGTFADNPLSQTPSWVQGQLVAGNHPSQYECNLSGFEDNNTGLKGCSGYGLGDLGVPSGYETSKAALSSDGTCAGMSASSFCGAGSDNPKSNAGLAVVPISIPDVGGGFVCSWVDNKSASVYFVPFKTLTEWKAFISSALSLSGVSLMDCALPMKDGTTTDANPNYDASCAPSYPMPNPAVYGRSRVSYWPLSPLTPSFACHNGETPVSSQLQWAADDPYWVTNFRYSPDVTLNAKDEVNGNATADDGSKRSINAVVGDQIAMSWMIGSTATSCSASCDNGCTDWNWKQNIPPFPSTRAHSARARTSRRLAAASIP